MSQLNTKFGICARSRAEQMAALLVIVGCIYIAEIVIGIKTSDPQSHAISGIMLLYIEITTIVSAVLLCAFMIMAIDKNKSKKDTSRLLLIAISVIMAGVTSVNHLISIYIRIAGGTEYWKAQYSFEWPTVSLCIEIFAWDLLFGIGILILALTNTMKKSARIIFLISGVFSIMGLLAVILNDMNYRIIGILGYTIVPVIGCATFIKFGDWKRAPKE